MKLYPLLKLVAPRLAHKYAVNYRHGFAKGYPLINEPLHSFPRQVTRSYAFRQGLKEGKQCFKASGSPRVDYYG